VLILSRKLKEAIVIDGGIRVEIHAIRGNIVRLAIHAPDQIRVDREEVARQREQWDAAQRAKDHANRPTNQEPM
jgi:carbon storage regulator CsrA